jgi:leader peptidase (prepilin peptidase)/N-methyltransferase
MLAWYENVPVLSYLVLRGKCRSCGTSISPMYPIIESITGAMFLAGYLWYGPSALLVIRLLFGCAMIVLFVIDLEHKILPNVITLPGIVVGFLLSEVEGPVWLPSLIGIAVVAGSLFAIAEIYYRVRYEEGLGMGDVKMLGMIGAFLGWKLVQTLALPSIAGSIVGVGVLIAKRIAGVYAMPFEPSWPSARSSRQQSWRLPVNWYLQFYR